MSVKRRIILFTAFFPGGNTESFLEQEILYLSKYFESIVIFPNSQDLSCTVREIPGNVRLIKPFFRYSKINTLFKEIFNFSPIYFFFHELIKKRYYTDLEYFLKFTLEFLRIRLMLNNADLKNIIDSFDNHTDIFYFYWGNKSANIIPFISKKVNNIIVRFHGTYDLYEDYYKYFFFREDLFSSLSKAILISQRGYDFLEERYPFIKEKKIVFRLGVSDFGFSNPSQDGIFRIVSCSGMIPLKRIHLIILALEKLSCSIEWTHFGTGILYDQLVKMKSNLPSNIKVTFQGHFPNQELRQFYVSNKIDLFINVSEIEGVPVSVMEALSSSIPVMATDVGGVAEIIDNSVGRLLPLDITPTELAAQIIQFHSLEQDKIIKIRNNARQRWNELCNADKLYNEFCTYLVNFE